jgi:hypothetical protein
VFAVAAGRPVIQLPLNLRGLAATPVMVKYRALLANELNRFKGLQPEASDSQDAETCCTSGCWQCISR